MLEVSELSHRFGSLVALDGVTFTVGDGEIVGLVGRNGAGKTTTMRAIMGILQPDAGEVRWGDHPLGERDRLAFGYMPEVRGLYPQMAVVEQLAYFAGLHGRPGRPADGALRAGRGRSRPPRPARMRCPPR